MNSIEARIVRSFKGLKSDIIQIQNDLVKLSQNQEELMKDFSDVREKQRPKTKTKVVTKTKIVNKP